MQANQVRIADSRTEPPDREEETPRGPSVGQLKDMFAGSMRDTDCTEDIKQRRLSDGIAYEGKRWEGATEFMGGQHNRRDSDVSLSFFDDTYDSK